MGCINQKPKALQSQQQGHFKAGECLSDARLKDLKFLWDIDNKVLGQGAFGTVYKARSKSDPNYQVAVKIINKVALDDFSRESLKNEV